VDGDEPTILFMVSIVDDESRTAGKGIVDSLRAQPVLREVSIDHLRSNLKSTLCKLRELFTEVTAEDADFPLKQAELSFEITSTGKIALLGTSAEVSGKGAITLTFGK
jgi:hypothetical protein